MEDDYEYACMKIRLSNGERMDRNLYWEARELAEAEVKMFSGKSLFYQYVLVRRRKAGEIEIVDEA